MKKLIGLAMLMALVGCSKPDFSRERRASSGFTCLLQRVR